MPKAQTSVGLKTFADVISTSGLLFRAPLGSVLMLQCLPSNRRYRAGPLRMPLKIHTFAGEVAPICARMGEALFQVRATPAGNATTCQVCPVQCLIRALTPNSVGSTAKPVAHASWALGALMLVSSAGPCCAPNIAATRHQVEVALPGCGELAGAAAPDNASTPPAVATATWPNGQPNM